MTETSAPASTSTADTSAVYVHQLRDLTRRGRELHDSLTAQGASVEMVQGATRIWQQDCAALIQQLSGGSKAHWLSRAHSDAYLVRSASTPRSSITGRGFPPRSTVPLAEIVQRLIVVLEQALGALRDGDGTSSGPGAASSHPGESNSAPRRFDFVHDVSLRPVLERAYAGSRTALQGGDFVRSFVLSSSILEAIITDALNGIEAEAKGGSSAGLPSESGLPPSSFASRIASAERAGLIKGGCARLPPAAYHYGQLTDDQGEPVAGATVSEREARLVSQVLHVVLKDLDPGR